MFYPFPYIKHIDQIREALDGREEFIISEKPEGFTVANYLINMTDTFPEIKLTEDGKYASREDELYAIRRECRGIKFDTKTGLVIQRLYHKFFNYGERPETQGMNLPEYVEVGKLLEKLDGSMLSPIILDGKIYWTTKMGVTDVALMTNDFLKANPDYEKFARHCADINHTPIFEFCSRKQRIVIDYPEDMLILTAVRENYSGRYLSEGEISYLQTNTNVSIPMVKQVHTLNLIKTNDTASAEQVQKDLAAIKTTAGLLDIIRTKKNIEGYVLRLRNGHMIKLKADDYVRIHKSKEALQFEKDVIDLIVNEKTDDLKPFLIQSDLDRLNAFEDAFWHGVNSFIEQLNAKFYDGAILAEHDKKVFAVSFVSKQDPFIRPLLFQLWDNKEPRQIVIDLIKKNLGSQTAVNSIRQVFNTSWNMQNIQE